MFSAPSLRSEPARCSISEDLEIQANDSLMRITVKLKNEFPIEDSM